MTLFIKKLSFICLGISMLLFISACGGTDSPTPVITPEASPTELVSDEAIEITPLDTATVAPETMEEMQALLAQAATAYEQKDLNTALTLLDQVLTVLPQSEEALFLRGKVYFELGEFAKSLGAFDDVVTLNPQNAEAYNQRGRVNDTLGDYEQALSDYEQALALNPNLAEPHLNRGYLLLIVYGDNENAIAEFQQYVTLAPDAPDRDYVIDLIADLEFELTAPDNEAGDPVDTVTEDVEVGE